MQSQGSMADPMVINVDESKSKKPEMNKPVQENSAKKSLKRKRPSLLHELTVEDREARIDALCLELEGLFKYCKEVSDEKVNLDSNECGSSNSAIVCLLEESTISLSNLVDEIYEKMKAREGGSVSAITAAFVKSSVLFIGQRSLYGVPNVDVDV